MFSRLPQISETEADLVKLRLFDFSLIVLVVITDNMLYEMLDLIITMMIKVQ